MIRDALRKAMGWNSGPKILAATIALIVSGVAVADTARDAAVKNDAAVRDDDGLYSDKNGAPTYKIGPDGAVDWRTYVGYLRYNSNCDQCHGLDGNGSSFGPALKDSLKTLSYPQFLDTVTNGKKAVNTAQQLVMPSFANNKNIMCYIDDIYVYLRARSAGVVPSGRPDKHAPKSKTDANQEDACMGPIN